MKWACRRPSFPTAISARPKVGAQHAAGERRKRMKTLHGIEFPACMTRCRRLPKITASILPGFDLLSEAPADPIWHSPNCNLGAAELESDAASGHRQATVATSSEKNFQQGIATIHVHTSL
jgi:hypothetical protein